MKLTIMIGVEGEEKDVAIVEFWDIDEYHCIWYNFETGRVLGNPQPFISDIMPLPDLITLIKECKTTMGTNKSVFSVVVE